MLERQVDVGEDRGRSLFLMFEERNEVVVLETGIRIEHANAIEAISIFARAKE